MGSTDSDICFEGLLVKVAKSRNTQSLWCTLDGKCLAFYRNKRSSCMFTIEITRVKSVTPFLDKNQFEIVTEKSFLFSAETAELCHDWINHIEEARQQDGQLVLTSQKQEDQPVSPRRGSLPQHHAVSNALKRLSGKSEKGEGESSNTKPPETKADRTSTTKNMINRFSTGVLQKETECPRSRPSRPTSGGKVNSLLLRFSSEGSNQSSTSPVSPSPQSPVRPFSPKSVESQSLSNTLEQPSSSSLTARPLSVGKEPTYQKMQGITTTSSGTKIELSEVSRVANVVVPSHSETIISGDRCTDSGYTSGICGSPTKETIDKFDLDTVDSKPISEGEETEGPVVLRPKGLTNGDVDDPEETVTMRRPKTQEKYNEEVEEEMDEDEGENEHDGPNLQLLDDLMSLTFEEIEVPQSSPVDLKVAKRIIEMLDVPWVSLLSMDSFYKVLGEKEHKLAGENEYNFDHPEAFDFDLMIKTLKRLKEGKNVEVPVYNFITHSRDKQTKTIYGANVVIFEGIMSFVNKELLELMDMRIFVDTDSDIRLARRLKRDIAERGRELEGVLKQYNKFVKPAFEHYIEPSMTHADIIVPRGGENIVAVSLIVMHVHTQLQKRGFKLRSKLALSANNGSQMPDSLYVLEKTPQVQGLHTFIRNRETSRDEFIFYSKRLMRLLFEYAMSMLPFKSVKVETPQSVLYDGKRLNTTKICGVSILRAGETMEQALCEVCKDIRLGKILIQTNFDTGEPELHYLRLPKDIKETHVMLMDATVATGAAAMMAIRVLLDHDVPEENILLLSLLMAQSGVHSVAYAFPKVKIVTTAVDKHVNDKFHILPGIGNFGDRYFGTDMPSES